MKLHPRSKVKMQFWQNGLDRAVAYHESIMNAANYSSMLSVTLMLQVICKNIPKSTPDTHENATKVLDLGSGTGILTDTLTRFGYDILSMDRMLGHAQCPFD